jgi:hypothetical protein
MERKSDDNEIRAGEHRKKRKEARMHLIHKPFRPEWLPFMLETFSFKRYQQWLPYLNAIDAAYWNTELLER